MPATRRRRGERDGRGGLVGVLRADPAHDLAVVVGCSALNVSLSPGCPLGMRARARSRRTRRDRSSGPAVAGPGDLGHGLVDLKALVGLDRLVELRPLDRHGPAGAGLIGHERKSAGQLHVDLGRRAVVALVRDADVEAGEAAAGAVVGCSVTWADAAAGSASAAAAVTAATARDRWYGNGKGAPSQSRVRQAERAYRPTSVRRPARETPAARGRRRSPARRPNEAPGQHAAASAGYGDATVAAAARHAGGRRSDPRRCSPDSSSAAIRNSGVRQA